MSKRIVSMYLLVFILSTQPLIVFTQKKADLSDWSNVKVQPLGVGILVETKDGRSFAGTLDTVSDSMLQIARKGKTDTVELIDIKKVYRTGEGSRAKSIAIMTAIGAGVGFGAAGALLGATGGSDSTPQIFATGTAIGAGIGAALGAALGGHKRTLIYQVK